MTYERGDDATAIHDIRNVTDVAVLNNYLRGNPLVDWLERFGDEHNLHPHRYHNTGDVLDGNKHPLLARFIEWVRTSGGRGDRSIVDAKFCRETTQTAMTQNASLIVNPSLVASKYNLAIRPHALVNVSILPRHVLEQGWLDVDEVGAHRGHRQDQNKNIYSVVQCGGMGDAHRWKTHSSSAHVKATCAVAVAAFQEARSCDHHHGVEVLDAGGDIVGIVLGGCDWHRIQIATVKNADVQRHHAGNSGILQECRRATQWIQELRKHGHDWSPFQPTRWEMTVNMRALTGSAKAWSAVLKRIASATGEITQLYHCNQSMKKRAFTQGVRSIHEMLGFSELSTLQARIVWANHPSNANATTIHPRRLAAGGNAVQILHDLAQTPWFATDFETVQVHERQWTFMIATILYLPRTQSTIEHQVTLRNLTNEEQTDLIQEWLAWLRQMSHEYGFDGFRLVHWSAAEPRFLSKLRAQRTHAFDERTEHSLGQLQWIDIMDVFTTEGIVVPGAFDFKLKSIAKALYRLGKIASTWVEGTDVQDGYAAMRAAQRIYARRRTRAEHDMQLSVIREYNRIDTLVLVEIVQFLLSTYILASALKK